MRVFLKFLRTDRKQKPVLQGQWYYCYALYFRWSFRLNPDDYFKCGSWKWRPILAHSITKRKMFSWQKPRGKIKKNTRTQSKSSFILRPFAIPRIQTNNIDSSPNKKKDGTETKPSQAN